VHRAEEALQHDESRPLSTINTIRTIARRRSNFAYLCCDLGQSFTDP
jgi:hypothetical protein